jgi:hypothetical protein
MTPDPSFGQDGMVPVDPPTPHEASNSADGTLLLRADGEIIASITLFDGLDFTESFKPDVVANSGTVSGRFFNDINGNHKQEKNEPGLAYWQAYADLNNNGIYDTGEPSGFANAHGDYSINGLAPGTYIIREVRQEGWTRTTPVGAWPLGFYKVTVKANQTVSGLDFGNSIPNHAKGSISGTIFNDINGDQIQDNNEPALAGWQAYVDVNNNGVHDAGEPIATADKNGHYVISGLPAGGYIVREIRHDGWSRTTPPGAWPLGFNEVNLAPEQKSTGNNFGNAHASSALVSVSGTVYNDINGNGQLDPGETGLGGVQVFIYREPNTPVPWLATSTAADGSFAFNGLAPGTYFLYLLDDFTGWTGGTSDFTLLPGQSFHQDFFDHQT